MREIDLAFDNGGEFMEAYDPDSGNGELFVAAPEGEEPPDLGRVGSVLAANVFFSDLGLTYRVHVRLAWRRPVGDGRLVPGVGLGFLDEESERRDALVRIAHGEVDDWLNRSAPRHRLRARFRLKGDDGALSGNRVLDISETGLCVPLEDGEEPFIAGDQLKIALSEPKGLGLLKTRVEGRVVWSRSGGAEPAMGIELVDDSRAARDKMAKLIDKLKAAG